MAGQAGRAPGGLNMADGTTPTPAADDAALRANPHAFELFAALRLLERVHRDRPRLGRSARPSQDAVRLRQPPSLAFAPGDIAGYVPAGSAGPGRLDTWVLGLFGPNGPLPLHLTEYAIERSHKARDHTLRAFADVFHHRMLALFYRAWADAQPVVQGDRPEEDRFRFHVGALIGMGPDTGDAVVSTGTRHLAGRMLAHARNAEGLRCLLGAAFDVPVQVHEFIGEWMPLPGEAWILDGSRSVFGPEPWTADLEKRLAEFDIHPSAPLWGRGMLRSQGEAHALETAALEAADALALRAGLEQAGLRQERRATRLRPAGMAWDWRGGDVLELRFALAPGTYATTVLEEIGRVRDAAGQEPAPLVG